jgi:hypothetical protein
MTGPGPMDEPIDGEPIDGEAELLLSAYLDGEVSAAEADEVRSLLERSPSARARLESLRSVRRTLRALPAVEPPAGFFDDPDLLVRATRSGDDADGLSAPRSTGAAPQGFRPRFVRTPALGRASEPAPSASSRRHRSRRRAARGLAALGVVAVAAVLFVGVIPVSDRFVPPVDAFAARHGAMERRQIPAPDPGDLAFADMSDAALDAAGVPATMAGDFARVHGFTGRDGMVHVVFSDGRTMVSVYEQDGAVAWWDMPAGATRMDVAGAPAMDMRTGPEEVVVVDRGGRVYTVVSGGGHERVMDVVHALPESERSMMDRASDGCRSLVASFAAAGG